MTAQHATPQNCPVVAGTPSHKRQHAALCSPSQRHFPPGDWEACAAEVDALTPQHAFWQQPRAYHVAQPQQLLGNESELKNSLAEPVDSNINPHTCLQQHRGPSSRPATESGLNKTVFKQHDHQHPADQTEQGDSQLGHTATPTPTQDVHSSVQACSASSMRQALQWQHLLPAEAGNTQNSRAADGGRSVSPKHLTNVSAQAHAADRSAPSGQQQDQTQKALQNTSCQQLSSSVLQFVPASVRRKQSMPDNTSMVQACAHDPSVAASPRKPTVTRSYLAVLLQHR